MKAKDNRRYVRITNKGRDLVRHHDLLTDDLKFKKFFWIRVFFRDLFGIRPKPYFSPQERK